jgi:GntR family transcriptional regulator, rspAB operon transcriptional repressor
MLYWRSEILQVLEKISGESSREYITRVLRTNIVNLNLEPGRIITDKEIAEKLGVSRTPVREAFIKLEQVHLIEVYPQKGTCVSLINLDLVEEARFLRITLEKAVVRLASHDISEKYIAELEANLNMHQFYASKKNYFKFMDLDNEFHHIIFKACKKDSIYSLIETMNSHLDRIRMLRLAANIDVETILLQHQNILAVIKEGNAEKAEKVMAEHLTINTKMEQEMLRQQYPKYFKID